MQKNYKRNGPGQNLEDISSVNQSLIIKYLRRNGVCSRAQISKDLGLTQASISKITAQLIDEDIIYESGYITGEKGRRSIGVALNTHCKKVLGVRISRRSFAVGLFDLSGKLYENVSRRFSAETTLVDVIGQIREILEDYLNANPDVASIGVAVPGPFNRATCEILLTTSMATSDWTNVKLRDTFGEFRVPITFYHDAEAGALANWWFGSRVKEMGKTLVHFFVGDGVGAGYVAGGVVADSESSFTPEIGHISIDVNGRPCKCGNRGCLERYCSTFAFVEMTKEMIEKEYPSSSLTRLTELTPQDIFLAAEAGDECAQDAVVRLGTYVGYGAVNIINTFAPDVIVISNELARGGKRLLKRVREVVNERVTPAVSSTVSIQLEDDWMMSDPILYGAAAAAVEHCVESPLTLLAKIPEENK